MVKKLVLLLALLMLATSVFADGMVIKPCDAYWCTHRETDQHAVINFENGSENLLLFVNTEGNPGTEKFVWIFPIPANPNSIEVANIKGFPSLYGTELKEQVKGNFTVLAALNFVAAFPPGVLFLLVLLTGLTSTGRAYDGEMMNAPTAGAARDRGYDIVKHIDKYGIATEVVTAWDGEKFYNYLKARGTNLAPEAKERLGEYIGRDYSFIVSWISNPKEYLQQEPPLPYGPTGRPDAVPEYNYNNYEPVGVFVKFPTQKIYYPMKLTSIYSDYYVPATIDLVGFKEPQIFQNISKETKILFYSNDRFQYGLNEEEGIRKVFNGNIPSQLKFTRININTQAKYFTQDLEMDNNTSIFAMVLDAINTIWLLLAIVIFFALSLASVALTNKLLLGRVLGRKRVACLALSNFLTVFGFIATALILHSMSAPARKFSRIKAILGFWAIFFAISILFGIFALLLSIVIQ